MATFGSFFPKMILGTPSTTIFFSHHHVKFQTPPKKKIKHHMGCKF